LRRTVDDRGWMAIGRQLSTTSFSAPAGLSISPQSASIST
jgi:hypothetical protein